MKKFSILLIVVAGIVLVGCQDSSSSLTPHVPPAPLPTKQMQQPKEESVSSTRTIMLHTSNWEFTPSVITVKKGEQITLHAMGMEGFHGIAIPDLGINEGIDEGESKIISIPTDTPGTFSFFCSVPCGKGHKDMVGTIVIEE
jgi:cytochrome c oxidase subunit II